MTIILQLLTLLLLVLLPQIATGFCQSTLQPPNTHSSYITLYSTSNEYSQTSIRSQINKVLIDEKNSLLSDSSKLMKRSPKSNVDEDNAILSESCTTDQLIHQVLLSSRFDLPFLSRCNVGPSTIDGAGRGLFASEDIAEGEIITCYPGDAILYEVKDENDEDEEVDIEVYNVEDEEETTYCLWGSHISSEYTLDEDAVFDGTDTSQPLTSTAVAVDGEYSIMGCDLDCINPAYSGHYANDGAGHLALEKPNSQRNKEAAIELGLDWLDSDDTDDDNDVDEEEVGVEENIAAYVLKSLEVANAMHRSVDKNNSHIATVATRDIKKGEEVFVTYGPDYWLGHA